MKIIEPSFRLSTPYKDELTLSDGIQMLRFIETQARISHRSEDRQTENSWEKFIQAVVLQHGDWSVVEHVVITATIRTDRGITHELVRHRLFSFTQESTRFVRYGEKRELEFVAPAWQYPSPARFTWEAAMGDAEATYNDLIEWGAKPQEARAVLPNSLAATIAITGNLRNWRHFFLMRTTKETHPDMKRVTVPMLAKFQETIPLLYQDITPNQRQIENLGKAR